MPNSNRILVVDDNAATRYSVRRVLEHHRFSVEEAETGGDGLARLMGGEFAAVVLDVNLPDMSGFDVVRQLREDARTRLLPVVHVSAASIATGDLITGLDAGADAYLIHPVDPDVLLATLRTLLRVRRTEEALRASEARFREIFEHIGAPIAVVDSALCVHDANAAFGKLLGDVDLSGALETRFGGQPDTLAQLRLALARQQRWKGTLALGTPTGVRMTEWRLTPYRDPDMGMLFVEDVTEQHQRERAHRQEMDSATSELAHQIAERERTEAELMQAQKMDSLGKLTGGIAHDFNNLLTSIISALDMIAVSVEGNRLEKVPRYTEIASSSAHRAAALTQRMLAFARKQSLDPQPFNVGERVRSLEDMLRRSIGENIELEFELGDEPLVAIADPNQFENVMLNLVINARDALGGEGAVRIRGELLESRREADLADGTYVSIKVIDNGVGIPPEVLAKVFEPFFTTKPQGEGTGLGLSMTYGFARQSGGLVRIVSEPGHGTEVELLLPQGESPQPVPAPLPSRAPRGKSERVLLVDDTDVVRLMVREVLQEAGYQVVDAANADDALYELRADAHIDLLLSDVGLPGMNGRALADAARELRPALPVLFITGYTEGAAQRQEFLDHGMALLPKPFSLDELLHKVRQMLV
ncbi:response regulator [Stenotrophomonas sp. HITSZ_GD]|uniref:response regulator n=1 Tax=Stenotrophomonas sp. HITSZ_GD TaxID=3037248 RepID=UPI00240E0BCE|nr:response regulator [Stenotrophomonas sp. HITSZ_GD]MDG2526031.1 response regulator [Stenotrophomonas sp. HITSZ_GD]